MHELIYGNMRQLSLEKLQELGRTIGLDGAALERSVRDQAFKKSIDKDYQDGVGAQVAGTPTIFLNGKRVPRRDIGTFERMIDAALRETRGREAAPPADR